jgi:hypothetical protein
LLTVKATSVPPSGLKELPLQFLSRQRLGGRVAATPNTMTENREPDANAVMTRDMGSTNTIVVDSGDNEKTHEFNEQTNYVPKRAIITVSLNSQETMTSPC